MAEALGAEARGANREGRWHKQTTSVAAAHGDERQTSPHQSARVHAMRPLVELSGSGEPVPINEKCGHVNGHIPAYSNYNAEAFKIVENYDGHFFTGIRWQCVEFARRWLLERKALVLPQYFIAAHIIYGSSVYDLHGKPVNAAPCWNGGTAKPVPDCLIIYPMHVENFPGHIGVITEVGDDYVCVADQNRYFHSWGDKTYSARFRLDVVDGRYYIRDPECECSGWLTFPGVPNRDEAEKLVVPESMSAPPEYPMSLHYKYFARSILNAPQPFRMASVFVRSLTWYFGHKLKAKIARALPRWLRLGAVEDVAPETSEPAASA